MKAKHRFYIQQPWDSTEGATITVHPDVAHHMHVLRLRQAELVEIFDGNGNSALAYIEYIDKKKAIIKIHSKNKPQPAPKFHTTIAYGIGKSDKTDTVIRMTTELGVNEICLMHTQYSVIKIDNRRSTSKINHWQKIAIEASRQSGRVFIPHIPSKIFSFSQLISRYEKEDNENSIKILLHPVADTNLSDIINELNERPNKAIILIGPEGGFSSAEVEEALQKQFLSVNLGQRILRTETAPTAVLSVLQYVFGDFGR